MPALCPATHWLKVWYTAGEVGQRSRQGMMASANSCPAGSFAVAVLHGGPVGSAGLPGPP